MEVKHLRVLFRIPKTLGPCVLPPFEGRSPHLFSLLVSVGLVISLSLGSSTDVWA